MSDPVGLVLDVLAAVCLLGGAFLAFTAGLGVLRFGDLLARMHTATKPQVLGQVLMMIGLGLRLRHGEIIWMLLIVAIFQMLTSPVAAHMVSRAGYRTGKVRREVLEVDELTQDLDEARAEIVAEAMDEEQQDRDEAAAQDRDGRDHPARADGR